MSRRDLLRIGFTPQAIDHRLASGRLHLVMRGVYVVGWPDLTQERRWMAAVLACGKGALLSHRSAAALWGIGDERQGRVDVSIRRRCKHRRRGIRASSRPSLPDRDVETRRGIPVTCLTRTLVDLATELGTTALERAVNEADKRDLVDPETLRAALDEYSGEPGVRALLARDRLRDQAHTAAGLIPLRFTHRQVKYEPSHVRKVLRQTARRIRERPNNTRVGL